MVIIIAISYVQVGNPVSLLSRMSCRNKIMLEVLCLIRCLIMFSFFDSARGSRIQHSRSERKFWPNSHSTQSQPIWTEYKFWSRRANASFTNNGSKPRSCSVLAVILDGRPRKIPQRKIKKGRRNGSKS